MATKKKIAQNKVEPIVKEETKPLVENPSEHKVEPIVETEPIKEVQPTAPISPIAEPVIEIKKEDLTPIVTVEESELTIEEKIVNFVNSREGEIKLNAFLKSLYPRPLFNEPEIYLRQGESKSIKHTIQKLIDKNEFKVKGDTHKLLGTFYYNDTEQKTKYHNINTIEIIVDK